MDVSTLPQVEDLLVAVDTETSGLHPDEGARVAVVSLAWGDPSAPETRVFPFDLGADTPLGSKIELPSKYRGAGFWDVDPNLPVEQWSALCDWLEKQSLIFHNAKFDLHIFDAGLRGRRRSGRDLHGSTVWDTMVANSVLTPLERNSLKDTAARLWGEQEKDAQKALTSWLSKNAPNRWDLAPWDLMEPYAAQDVVLTLRLFHHQMQEIEQGLVPFEQVERKIDVALCLYRMERRGVGLDTAGMLEAAEQVRTMARDAERGFCLATGATRATEEAARTFWFEKRKEKPRKTTETGKVSVSQDVVRDLAARGVPGAKEWQRYTKLENALSMWYDAWPRLVGADGRLRANYRQTKMVDDRSNRAGGTVSGRLAVDRWQVQAIPHDRQLPEGCPSVRSFLVPLEGFELYEIDLSQAEMRTVAGRADCGPLIERFRAGDDAHDATCRLVFEIEPGDPEWKMYRDVAKRLNFGVLYGAGAAKIAEQIHMHTGRSISTEQVRQWLGQMRSSMSELYRYGKRLEQRVERVGNIELAGGALRWFAPGTDPRIALNADIQGSVAEVMLIAMIEIELQVRGALLAQVHDSVVVEVDSEETARQVQQILVSTFEQHIPCPFESDLKPFGRVLDKSTA